MFTQNSTGNAFIRPKSITEPFLRPIGKKRSKIVDGHTKEMKLKLKGRRRYKQGGPKGYIGNVSNWIRFNHPWGYLKIIPLE